MFIVVEPLVWLFMEILMIPVRIALWIGQWLLIGLFYALKKIIPFTLDIIESLVKFLAKQTYRLFTYCWNSIKEYRRQKYEERFYVYP